MATSKSGLWRPLLEAAAISLIILLLFYYWFALADRYAVFLYGHTANGIPLTQPFDAMTSSRYWMAGLAAAGIVLLLYTAANWLGGRLAARRGRQFGTPEWWRVWLACAPLLVAGIPAITMTANQPTLPWPLALACAAAALVGLALALLPGRWAAERPGDLLWLAADGVGLMPSLLLLRAVELPGQGLSVSPATAWTVAAGSVIGGAVWLALVGRLRAWRRRERPGAAAVFLAGLALSYVLMPLVHYLMAESGDFRYISDAANFFAAGALVQAAAIVAAGGLALLATRPRRSRANVARRSRDGRMA